MLMEAVSSSETSVSIYQTTWRNIPEDSHLDTRCFENLKSHISVLRLVLQQQICGSAGGRGVGKIVLVCKILSVTSQIINCNKTTV
jgi:hypothetical protein